MIYWGKKHGKKLLVLILFVMLAVGSSSGCGEGQRTDSFSSGGEYSMQSLAQNIAENSSKNEESDSPVDEDSEEQNSKHSVESKIENISPVSKAYQNQESSETVSVYRSRIDEALDEYREFSVKYSTKFKEVKNKLGNSYSSYVNSQSYLTEWFVDFKDAYSSLFFETNTMTKFVFDQVKETIPANEYSKWNDELDYIYKNFYNTAFDVLFKELYEDIFDNLLSEYYDTIFENRPNGIDYSTWLNVKSDFYNAYLDTKSDLYNAYLESL